MTGVSRTLWPPLRLRNPQIGPKLPKLNTGVRFSSPALDETPATAGVSELLGLVLVAAHPNVAQNVAQDSEPRNYDRQPGNDFGSERGAGASNRFGRAMPHVDQRFLAWRDATSELVDFRWRLGKDIEKATVVLDPASYVQRESADDVQDAVVVRE